MPISFEHQPPFSLVGQASYNAGIRQSAEEKRRWLMEMQMRAAENRQRAYESAQNRQHDVGKFYAANKLAQDKEQRQRQYAQDDFQQEQQGRLEYLREGSNLRGQERIGQAGLDLAREKYKTQLIGDRYSKQFREQLAHEQWNEYDNEINEIGQKSGRMTEEGQRRYKKLKDDWAGMRKASLSPDAMIEGLEIFKKKPEHQVDWDSPEYTYPQGEAPSDWVYDKGDSPYMRQRLGDGSLGDPQIRDDKTFSELIAGAPRGANGEIYWRKANGDIQAINPAANNVKADERKRLHEAITEAWSGVESEYRIAPQVDPATGQEIPWEALPEDRRNQMVYNRVKAIQQISTMLEEEYPLDPEASAQSELESMPSTERETMKQQMEQEMAAIKQRWGDFQTLKEQADGGMTAAQQDVARIEELNAHYARLSAT